MNECSMRSLNACINWRNDGNLPTQFFSLGKWIYTHNIHFPNRTERNKEKPKQLENLLKQITVLRSKVWKSNIQSTNRWYIWFFFRFFSLPLFNEIWLGTNQIRLKIGTRIWKKKYVARTKDKRTNDSDSFDSYFNYFFMIWKCLTVEIEWSR